MAKSREQLTQKLEDWLISVRHRCHPTGSQLFKSDPQDRDYILPLEVIPAHLQALLIEDSDGVEFGHYSGEFYNIKVGSDDFVITKTREEYEAWKYASRMSVEYLQDAEENRPRHHSNFMEDKTVRAAVFETLKFLHRQSTGDLVLMAKAMLDAKEIPNTATK